jgi:ABC-2 type transport system permease protein
MAVYKRTYRGYSGDITPAWSRFLIIFRYSRRNLFRSKLMTGFFVLCFFAPVLALLGIYANDHLGVLLGGPIGGAKLIKTDGGQFFLNFLNVQTAFAFILTAFIGPGLVSPDLANGALTVYLCRPISRVEYVLGKLSVLAIILSWITWIPALVLFFVQASLSGWDWMMQNLWIATGCFIASWIWILSISLLALALSAWVKWRIAAGGLLLGVLFIGAGFALAINGVLQTQQGYLLNLSKLINIIWQDLFHDSGDRALPVAEAWFGVLAFAAGCFYLLMKKIRANEVVR